MSTQRIQPVDPPFPDELTSLFDVVMPAGVPPLNIFRTVGRNPRVLSRMVHGGLLDRGAITIQQRELVILRTCAVCGAEYEWGVHVAAYSEKAALTQRQIAGICAKNVDPDLWSEEARSLIDMVDELHNESQISDSTWSRIAQYFDDDQLVELVMLAGLYHAVSFIANGFHLQREAFAPTFPHSA